MSSSNHPSCFGDIETVFPLGRDGLRRAPEECMQCGARTDCLRTAMAGPKALEVREEMLERAHRGGLIGTLQRWSRKKVIHRMKQSRK